MNEQFGWRGALRNIKNEAPRWATLLPQLPRLTHAYLAQDNINALREQTTLLLAQQRTNQRWLMLIVLLLTMGLSLAGYFHFYPS